MGIAHRLSTAVLIFVSVAAISACGSSKGSSNSVASISGSTTSRIQLLHRASLGGRLSSRSQAVTVDRTKTLHARRGTTGTATINETFTLTGEIAAPTVNSILLGATGVSVRGNDAFVSYNAPGADYAGAVQHITFDADTNPTLESELDFTDRDINDVTVCGNRMYLAMASSATQSATVGYIDLGTDRTFDSANLVEVTLEGFAANNVRCSETTVAVSFGDQGGVSTFDKDLNPTSRITVTIADARSVDFWQGTNFAALAGSVNGAGGTVSLIQNNQVASSIATGGATIPQSKSKIEVVGNIAAVALNDGGVQLLDLGTGAAIADLDTPVVDGLSASVTVSNSVTMYNDLVFIANGEAGVYLGKLDAAISQNPTNIAIGGSLVLGTNVSANDVKFSNDKLFVAAGTGGFKVIKVVSPDYATALQNSIAADANSTDDN